MANQHIEISIIDADWPRLKIIVNTNNREIKTAVAQYDIANSQFTPPVADALKFAVEDVIKSRKGRI